MPPGQTKIHTLSLLGLNNMLRNQIYFTIKEPFDASNLDKNLEAFIARVIP